MAETKVNVLIVGASGNLGSLVTRECLNRNEICVKGTIVFDQNLEKCCCEKVKQEGGCCLKADLCDINSFSTQIPQNVHTVISTVFGNDETTLKGQSNLLEVAKKMGVKRFVPSDFLSVIWNCQLGENFLIDQRLKFRECLEKSGLKGLHFSHGIFMETYFWLVEKNGYFGYWGDINQKIDLTCQEDVARFVAAAVARPNRVGDVMVCGSQYSTREIVDLYNKLTGKNLEAKCLGSIDDLKNKISELKGSNDPFMAVQYGLMLPIFDGRAKIKNCMNNEFPEVIVTKLEDFIKKIESKGLQYNYTLPDIVSSCCQTEIKS